MKEFLSRSGIEFTERNITLDPKAREEVMALDIRSTPATVINGKPILGYSPNEVARVLDLGFRVEPSQTLEQMLDLIPRELEACITSFRQMPDQHLDTPTLDGSRTMSMLAPHIIDFIDNTMIRIDTLKWPESNRRSWKSFQDIADYAEGALARWRAWAPRQTEPKLREVPPEGSVAWHYSGSGTGYEFLDYIGNHTTHHLRQFYYAMDNLGIPPSDRIPDSWFPQEYIQTIVVVDDEERERVWSQRQSERGARV